MSFMTPLQVELQKNRKTWRLMAPFVYQDEGGSFEVPAGFETDFTSVPRLPIVFDLVGEYGHAAATLHDYLYRNAIVSRKDADALFYRALRSTGIAKWRAGIMWAGVRIGGSRHYGS